MLIPVFTVYAQQLKGATPTLIGLALGIYGLSQGLLQIPFGMLSDHFGRKPLLTLGLALFAIGSLIGAFTDSIYGMIIARVLQGSGAIGSVLIALLADLTIEEHRTKAMAIIGLSIGLSFGFAMVISPVITQYFGLSGIFYLTTILALLGLILLYTIIPSPQIVSSNKEPRLALFSQAIKNKELQKLNLGILLQHLILTSTFYAIPIALHQLQIVQLWHLYLPLMVGSFLCMLLLIHYGEKAKKMSSLFVFAVGFTGLSQLLLSSYALHFTTLCLALFIYFIAFNFLEAALPSQISKKANKNSKGTAMGIYSTCQFLGIFIGGTLAGMLFHWAGITSIFIMNTVLSLLWFCIVKASKTGI